MDRGAVTATPRLIFIPNGVEVSPADGVITRFGHMSLGPMLNSGAGIITIAFRRRKGQNIARIWRRPPLSFKKSFIRHTELGRIRLVMR